MREAEEHLCAARESKRELGTEF